MQKKKEMFLEILILELDDLNEDIKVLIKECEEKYFHEEISNYVFMENLAVLNNELFGVTGFKQDVKDVNPGDFEELDDLKDFLMDKLEKRINEKGIAYSINILVERKMNKVINYVKS